MYLGAVSSVELVNCETQIHDEDVTRVDTFVSHRDLFYFSTASNFLDKEKSRVVFSPLNMAEPCGNSTLHVPVKNNAEFML